MEDLVLLRELIKTAARGHIVDLNVLFRHLNFDALFECVLARAVSPPSAAAVARAFHFLGIHTAAACAQSAIELTEFARWYSRRFYSPLQLDAMPDAFEPFRQQMGNVYTLSRTTICSERSHCPLQSADQATRPLSEVRGDRIGRFASLRLAGLDHSRTHPSSRSHSLTEVTKCHTNSVNFPILTIRL